MSLFALSKERQRKAVYREEGQADTEREVEMAGQDRVQKAVLSFVPMLFLGGKACWPLAP